MHETACEVENTINLKSVHWFISACQFSYKEVHIQLLKLGETGNFRLISFKAVAGKPLYLQQTDLALN